MYNHVLVAVDLSDDADVVLSQAELTARLHGARLSAVTVVKPLTHVYGGLDMAPISGGAVTFEQEAMEQATSEMNKRGEKFGVKADDQHVLLGSPAHEVRQLASELDCDLIVIGTHGRHGLGLLLGSTANGVLHGTPCDCLAVRVENSE